MWRYRSPERWREILSQFNSLRDAAAAHGYESSCFSHLLKSRGIKHGFIGTQETKLAGLDPEDLEAIYRSTGHHLQGTADTLGVHTSTLRRELVRHGIPTPRELYLARRSC